MLQTFEQFEQFQDDGMKHELLKGAHIVLPPANARRSRIRHKLLELLRPHVLQHQIGDVYIAAGFKLSSDNWLKPDVSFLRTAQIQATDPDGYFEGAPTVAIEIASDSNTTAHLDSKIGLYFEYGSEEVWVVYPQTRRICVHHAGGELRSDLFPGWSVRVGSLFLD